MFYNFPTIFPLSSEPQFGLQVKIDLLWNGFVAHCKIHDVFHISLLTPVHEDTVPGRTQPPPDPVTITEEGEDPQEHYIIDQYINSAWVKNRNGTWTFKYLVKWVGYDNQDATWEPRDKLEADAKDSKQHLGEGDDDFDLEEDFFTRHPDAPRPDDPVNKRERKLKPFADLAEWDKNLKKHRDAPEPSTSKAELQKIKKAVKADRIPGKGTRSRPYG